MISSELLAVTYGLSSAITWGAGDFSGGLAAKRGNVLTVILFSQLIGILPLIAGAFLFSDRPQHLSQLWWGGTAGICGAMGLAALYKGLAVGRMGIVAPISAVGGALVPILVALFTEGLPRLMQAGGFGVALVAVWVLSASGNGRRPQRQELQLSLTAGVGFGLFFVLIDRVSDAGVIWPLLAARTCSVCFLCCVFAARGRFTIPTANQWSFVALAGLLDVAGNSLFALASQQGRLDVSAVLSSMYPASTVVLAWWLLKERLHIQQAVGIIATIVALGLIAA